MTVLASPATPESAKVIDARAWLTATFGLVACFVALNLLLAWKVDIFGILRDTHGRRLTTSRHERKAKYLLNFHYVPQNFDALVTGASAQANWKLEGLSQYRFYNESMLGSDGVEERMLVDKALETGHFKVALVGISTGITDRSDLQDGLDHVDPHEALGSFYLYVKLADRLHDRLTHRRSDFYPDGSWEFPQHKMDPPDPNYRYSRNPEDLKATAAYRQMVENLIAHGVRIIYVIAPHFSVPGDGSREIIAEYDRHILSGLPAAPVIDFNAEEYASLRANPENMIDSDHLSDRGVPIYSQLVIERMHQILHDR